MKSIGAIARNTCREILRDRILYGILVFAVLFLAVSMSLGQLSYAEQGRISLDFGLAGIQFCAFLVSVFVGSTLVSRELEKRTIFTLLTHAVTRTEFIVGKFLGMIQVILIILLGLFAVVLAVMHLLHFPFNAAVLWSLFGILIEASLLLSATIFFGVFTTPMMSVTFSIGLFLIGHWLSDLLFFATKSESPEFLLVAKFITFIVPDLERFNWKTSASLAQFVPTQEVWSASIYGIAWISIFLCLSAFIFRRRDFG